MNDGGDCRTAPATLGLLNIGRYPYFRKKLKTNPGEQCLQRVTLSNSRVEDANETLHGGR